MNERRTLFARVVILLIVIGAVFIAVSRAEAPAITHPVPEVATTTPIAEAVATTTPHIATSTATSTITSASPKATTSVQKSKKTSPVAPESKPVTPSSSPNEIVRIQNPYTIPPLTFETVNTSARQALVNIFCATPAGVLKPITGSGIMIDPRGVVLTNAHVAQYVLIAQSQKTDLTCEVRTGAPAARKWVPVVMYIPPVWVEKHASEIVKSNVRGTGEHDYALLYMSATFDGKAVSNDIPSIQPDPREAIAFVDDNVLVASYPVEFYGGNIIQGNLSPVTSITAIRQLLTFGSGSADALSLGGVIGAQSGSSGGGVINQWNRIVGLITTTSSGATTGERDLHAISTAYISRDLAALTGADLASILSKDPKATAQAFAPTALSLADALIAVIRGN